MAWTIQLALFLIFFLPPAPAHAQLIREEEGSPIPEQWKSIETGASPALLFDPSSVPVHNGRPNILLTGFWPPTNGMLRPFSQNPDQNPTGWVGENWEGRGYNVYAFFPEFPNGLGRGAGDFEVDYQDTSDDFWEAVALIEPLAMITFSRAYADDRWILEGGNRTYAVGGWINDYLAPRQPSTDLPIVQEEPPGYERQSSLPIDEIIAGVAALVPTLTPETRPIDPSNFVSNFVGYHGNWYHDLHSSLSDPAFNIAAGHIHVGYAMSLAEANAAAEVSIRALIDHVDQIRGPIDLDWDGVNDRLDLDADGDGILDVDESISGGSGLTLFILGADQNLTSISDLDQNPVESNLGTLAEPLISLARSPHGNLYSIAAPTSGNPGAVARLLELDPVSGSLAFIGEIAGSAPSSLPNALAFDAQGIGYLATLNSPEIQSFDPNDLTALTPWYTLESGTLCNGPPVFFSQVAYVIVCQGSFATLRRLSLGALHQVTDEIILGTVPAGLSGLTVDSTGQLLAIDSQQTGERSLIRLDTPPLPLEGGAGPVPTFSLFTGLATAPWTHLTSTSEPFLGPGSDTDGDGYSDAWDRDRDDDGVSDFYESNAFAGLIVADTDADGTLSSAEALAWLQAEISPTILDADANRDGWLDIFDLNVNPWLFDSDDDGLPDISDHDDDNDGSPDAEDAFPLDPSESVDTDGDGQGDNADLDDDEDGVLDLDDAFPLDPFEQLDFDGDGVGDGADLDADNDGLPDDLEESGTRELASWMLFGDGLTEEAGRVEYDGTGFPAWMRQATSPPLATLGATDSFSLQWTQGPVATQSFFGLGLAESDALYSDVDYAIGIQQGDLYLYRSGVNQGFFGNVSEGDRFSIEVDDNVMEYRHNGTLLFSHSVAPGQDYAVDSSVHSGATAFESIVLQAAASSVPIDTDADGHPDFLDLDSDNDTRTDLVEAGLPDVDGDDRIDDPGQEGAVLRPPDADQDGIPDYLDLETGNPDNDGSAFDLDANGLSYFDTSGDGRFDGQDTLGGHDTNANGIEDQRESIDVPEPAFPVGLLIGGIAIALSRRETLKRSPAPGPSPT